MEFNRNQVIQFLRDADRSLVGLVNKAENLSGEASYADVKRDLGGINGTAYLFGSRMMKLADDNSDLDIFLDIAGKNYWKLLDHDTSVDYLRQIGDNLRKNSQWKVEMVIDAKVPVLKANYVPRNLECDISVSSGSGVENTKLIRYMFELQPQAFRLCHFIQMLMKLSGLDFKRYLVTMLVMFYLQKKNFLPSIKLAQSGLTRKEIDGWQLQFEPSRKIGQFQGISILNDFRPHVNGFFQFYRSFNFAVHAAVPYLGREVLKQSYANCNELNEFRGKLNDYKNDLAMAVTDSIKLDFNCAFDVGGKSLEKFVNYCGVAENLLAQYYRH